MEIMDELLDNRGTDRSKGGSSVEMRAESNREELA